MLNNKIEVLKDPIKKSQNINDLYCQIAKITKEECYLDCYVRVKKFLYYIYHKNYDNIIIVYHTKTLTCLIAAMLKLLDFNIHKGDLYNKESNCSITLITRKNNKNYLIMSRTTMHLDPDVHSDL